MKVPDWGLSIVQQLVKLMGGEISVNSVYTKGSKFIVTLEQDIIDDAELGTFTLTSRRKLHEGEQYKQSFEAPDAHILVVDDNEMNLVVVKKLLSETKIQVDTALSAAECLKLTQIQHYDSILMDHLMPEMDGVQCFHEIQTQAGGMCRDVPVIALTANAGSDNQLLYQKEGFAGYLAKPVSGMLLEAAVLSILPKELVNLNEGAEQSEVGKDILIFERVKEGLFLLRQTVSVIFRSLCGWNSAFPYVRIMFVRIRGGSWTRWSLRRMSCFCICWRGRNAVPRLPGWRTMSGFLRRSLRRLRM